MAATDPCPCRSLSLGMYAVARGCERHDEERAPSHMMCVCWVGPGMTCLVCEENARRGLAAGTLALGGARGAL